MSTAKPLSLHAAKYFTKKAVCQSEIRPCEEETVEEEFEATKELSCQKDEKNSQESIKKIEQIRCNEEIIEFGEAGLSN